MKKYIEIGNCAKQIVECKIVSLNGDEFIGSNYCLTPQKTCPRLPGEDYTKCKTICNQIGHAEEVAAMLAGDMAIGGTAYLSGHTYACDNCKNKLKEIDVLNIEIVA